MTEQVTQKSNAQKLYVVLHGLIPLVQDENGIHAFLIEMSGHTVCLGHWLIEKPLPEFGKDPLRLTGVSAGKGGIDPGLNLVVKVPDLDLEAITGNPGVHARIDFPKPDKLHSFFTADATGKLDGAQQPESQKYSAVQVFEYTVPGDSFEAVTLSRGEFAVWEDGGYTVMDHGGPWVSVLHIYNDPAGKADDDHAVEEFRKGSDVFGVDVHLADGPLPFPRDSEPSRSDLPPGLMVQELATLGARDRAVSHIVGSLRSSMPTPESAPVSDSLFCGAIFVLIELLRQLGQG